jgi:hypothetical protein
MYVGEKEERDAVAGNLTTVQGIKKPQGEKAFALCRDAKGKGGWASKN